MTVAGPQTAEAGALADGMNLYRGNLHSHTVYSIGEGEGTPAEAFTWARDTIGLDFYAITDHAEFLNPLTWWATGVQANRFNNDGGFVAMRGFEWSNPYFGHSVVLGTSSYTNAILNPTFDLFALWVDANNAMAQFNHPGREAGAFDSFAYDSAIVDNFYGLETGNKEVGANDGEYYSWYVKALDAGWKVAPVENQDNHAPALNSTHRTVIVSPTLTRASLMDALKARRVYGSDDPSMDISFRCNNQWLGSEVKDDESIAKLELIGNGGKVLASKDCAPDQLTVNWTPAFQVGDTAAGTNYFFLRVTERDTNGEDDLGLGYQVAVTAPVWVNIVEEVEQLNAYKGDLHSHSTYSDGDLPVAEVLANAESKGFDFFALTDHNNSAQWNDPGFASDAMTLLYGVEWTTGNGHANIWSNRPFDWAGTVKPTLGDAAAAIAAVHSFNSPGQLALFSINHPYCPGNEWTYTFDQSKDADCMEVWNARYLWPNLNPFSVSDTLDAYIKAGKMIGAVGGSDSHVHNSPMSDPVNYVQTLYHDLGVPTTWAYAPSAAGMDILEALRDGHASISYCPDGPSVRFMADAGYLDGATRSFETIMGESLPAAALGNSTLFRVEVAGAGLAPAVIVVKKNGQLLTATVGIGDAPSFEFTDVPADGDYYTVEIRQIGTDIDTALTMQVCQLAQIGWVTALSNPIYVLPNAEPAFLQIR